MDSRSSLWNYTSALVLFVNGQDSQLVLECIATDTVGAEINAYYKLFHGLSTLHLIIPLIHLLSSANVF